MLDTSIKVKTEYFDGPLGLLLLLIQKEEMDIRSLDLTKITKQYLDYLEEMKELNFDLAGDYLYLAATLLLLKSKSCVTDEEVAQLEAAMEGGESLHITSQAELIRRLEELNHFQKMGEKLMGLPQLGKEIFVKPKVNRKEIVNSILVPMELDKLTLAMMDLIIKEKRKYTVVKRDRLSIKEKLSYMKQHLEVGQSTTLEELVDNDGGKNITNIVITFISLLELARLKRLSIYQNEELSTVYVEVTKDLKDFDVDSANGFEEENPDAPAAAKPTEESAVVAASSDEAFVGEQEISASAEEETLVEEVEIPEELEAAISDEDTEHTHIIQ
jgi:segregation and condensation protein A